MEITQNLIFSGMFINRRRLWAAKANHIPQVPLSFLFFFFFFFSLSSPLFFLSLFFFICSSLEQKAHTHQPLTRIAFFLLSSNSVFFLFFLFCSSPISHSHTDPRPPKPRDHRRQSSITHRKTPPRIRSPHRCYRNHSSIWPKRQNQHP